MSIRRAVGLAGWLAFAALACPGQDERTLKVYPLQAGDPGPIVEALQALVGDDGKIVHDKKTGRLLILTTPKRHEHVAAVMQELNVPPQNIRLDVRFVDVGESIETGLGATGGAAVKTGKHGTHTRVNLNAYAASRSTRTDSLTQQTLLVQSGNEAALKVGEQVPFTDWLIEYGRHWGYVQQQTFQMRDLGASLVVQARTVGTGPLVTLTLTPELSGLVDGARERVRFSRVSTTVTVRDGQTVTIGGLGEHKDFFDRFLVGMDRSGQTRRLNVTLTAHITDPMARH